MKKIFSFFLMFVLVFTTTFLGYFDYAKAAVPTTPTVTAPTASTYNNSRTPTITSSTFSGSPSQTSSDWKITTDAGGVTVVWSVDDDATNLESIVVNTSNGTFAGVLTGKTQLDQFVTYHAFVRHTNGDGDSSWSSAVSFSTEVTGSTASQTWDFDDGTPSSVFDFSSSDIDVNVSSNSQARLKPTNNFTALGNNRRRRAITVNNAGTTVTDYQVKIDVIYDAEMQADFDDLRFTDSDGTTEIDYWIEDYTASATATVWAEIPSLTGGDYTIYMYYGDAALSTTESAANTFKFFDDFDGGSLGATWQADSTDYSVSGGAVRFNLGAATFDNALGYNLEDGYAVESRLKFHDNTGDYAGVLTASSSEYISGGNGGSDAVAAFLREVNTNHSSYTGTGSSASYDCGTNLVMGTTSTDQWYRLGLEFTTTNVNYYADNTLLEADSCTWTKNINYIQIGRYDGSSSGKLQDTSYDWLAIRKYDVDIGTSSVGGEEIDNTYTQVEGVNSTQKRQAITITNSGSALTNYQVRLDVTYDSDMQADFGDLRFTDDSGVAEIEYWIQDYVSSTDANVWVNVPSIAGTPTNTTIYMYYDTTATDTTTGNGSRVFPDFFDDFSSEESDNFTYGETYGGSGAVSYEVTGGELRAYSDNSWRILRLKKEFAPSETLVLNTKYKTAGNSQAYFSFMVEEGQTSQNRFGFLNGFGGASLNTYKQYCEDGCGWTTTGNLFTMSSDTWYINELHKKSTTEWEGFLYDLGYSQQATGNDTKSGWSDETWTWIMWQYENINVYYDHMFLRQYASSEPSPSFGSEVSLDASYSDVDINVASGGTHPTYTDLISFTETASASSAGTVTYQISNNGTTWYYHDGSSWVTASDDTSHHDSASTVNDYLSAFTTDVGTGDIYYKAFFASDGYDAVELNSVAIAYDAGDPTGLASFVNSAKDATTATFTWTAASDPAFEHYEIWYGTVQADAQNRNGAAVEWDEVDYSNLSTVSTATTVITGLTASTTYYAKIWAVDAVGNEMTVSDVSFTTDTDAEELTFSISDNTIEFGTFDNTASRYADDGDGDSSEAIAHTISVTTDATNGYTLYVTGETLTSGANNIDAIGGTSADLVSGTEQFGIRITASGGSGAVSSPYNHASQYAYGADVGVSDVIGSAVSGDDVATVYSVRYAANIAVTTAKGNYATTITYSAVGSY